MARDSRDLNGMKRRFFTKDPKAAGLAPASKRKNVIPGRAALSKKDRFSAQPPASGQLAIGPPSTVAHA